MNDKTYTVIELAETVGVPRTTINDWLSKYSPYIDYKTIGRRRVYTLSAVEVLKEISELRNKGLSSVEIDTELAKTHSQRAEPAEEKTEAASMPVPQNPKEAEPNENFALIAQKQSDEIGRLFAESFKNMADRIETLESKAGKAERKLYFGYGVVFILLLVLCALSLLLFFGMKTQLEQNIRNAESSAAHGSAIQTVGERTVLLAGSTADLKKGIDQLKSGLSGQKQEFDKALSAMKSSKEAETAAMKEKFALEKKNFLEKLESVSKENQKIVRELNEKLKHQSDLIANNEKAKQIELLESRLKEQEKQFVEMEKKSRQAMKELEEKFKAENAKNVKIQTATTKEETKGN